MIGVKNLKVNFPSNIICLPVIKDQVQLAEYYSLADLFLICSQKETFSMTCAEAISCGTKVIGFKSGAPESIFSEGKFVEYGNINELKKVILEEKFDYEKKEIKKYSTLYMVNKYEELYKENYIS